MWGCCEYQLFNMLNLFKKDEITAIFFFTFKITNIILQKPKKFLLSFRKGNNKKKGK